MNIEALTKIAEDGDNGGNGGGEVNWLPLLAGGGSAILAHLLQAPSKSEEKNQTTWDKIRRWLITLGAGAGGYMLGGSLVKSPVRGQKAIDIDKARQDQKSDAGTATALNVGSWGSHIVGGGADAYAGYNLAKALLPLQANAGIPLKTRLGGWGKGNWPVLAASAGLHGIGYGLGRLSDRYALSAAEKQRVLEDLVAAASKGN